MKIARSSYSASICHDAMAIAEHVSACLTQLDDDVVYEESGRWRISNGEPDQATTLIALDQDWLMVERPLAKYALARGDDALHWIWQLLDPAHHMASGARPVLVGEDRIPKVRAEKSVAQIIASRTDLHSNQDLHEWIALVCTDAATAEVKTASPAMRYKPQETSFENTNDVGQFDITELCALAGWSASTRSTSNESVVQLSDRDGDNCHAIGTVTDKSIRFQVMLDPFPASNIPSACLVAAAIALLRIAGSVRLVRPLLTRTDGHIAAGFNAHATPGAGPEEVNHTLSALALARRQIASEWNVLATEQALATAYLAYQGLR